MATYYHGGATEIQGGDGQQTLYLMNPSYAAGGYSDEPAQANMTFFMNSPNPMNLLSPSGGQTQQQSQQHFVGIPLQPADSGARPPPIQAAATHDLSAIHQGLSPRLHYNLWTPTPSNTSTASVVRPLQQGLSLSLSNSQQQQQQQSPYAARGDHETKIAGSSSSPSSAAAAASSNGMVGVQSVFMGSKYLKAAQQLLDEVVNLGKGGKLEQMTKLGREINDEKRRIAKRDKDADGAAGGGGGEGDCGTTREAVDLTTAERQELQMKKAKLANMLDEVEQRYRQYHHQMQIVVSSFETVAGFGSARTYTALALQTMSKQFRCLRDAISGQIKAACKSLGEEDCLAGGSKSVGSRLRFVDHHLRQQRALQQLGTAQYNAWRPQRGLPERAVSVLRAWLFEHFLHPYPKDSDKHMLAKETGLTRSQVSNWFINARVRLWKPMVEEMYMEETKEQEQNTGDDQKTSKSEGSEHSASRSASNHGQSPARTDQTESFKQNQHSHPVRIQPSNLGMFDNHNDDSFVQQRLKKARHDDESLHQAGILGPVSHEMKQQNDMSNRDLMMKFMEHGGGFGAYQIEQFGSEQFAPRFGGNGVSLTLGLPHCEPLPLSGSQQPTYLSNESIPLGRRLDIDMGSEEINYFSLNNNNNNNNNSDNNPSASHPPNATYESINIQNRRRFAAQLLPDYVA